MLYLGVLSPLHNFFLSCTYIGMSFPTLVSAPLLSYSHPDPAGLEWYVPWNMRIPSAVHITYFTKTRVATNLN